MLSLVFITIYLFLSAKDFKFVWRFNALHASQRTVRVFNIISYLFTHLFTLLQGAYFILFVHIKHEDKLMILSHIKGSWIYFQNVLCLKMPVCETLQIV